ncbi:alpha-1,2-galactosyltransferase [Schizosaccharomyces octosporus yFS286]|uniref:Alpha-1,2-galactosyltransferase n=1 Tax=Schizosaccharomyces octosporus (strain yFS286) TaxID=483514 RepID=S9RG86_SCHOY|nr:alpha-1,2-galactosyltransferase [Schizosaccharomyces octosporus yFS286]EPX73079.1 alpha-1,2-galactosyltransferase [Schizosaccharomyces octosporus yFS286]
MWNPKKKSEALAKFKSFPYPKPGTSNLLDSGSKIYTKRSFLQKVAFFVILVLCLGFLFKHHLNSQPHHSKVVMIVAVNDGGGVMDVKRADEWDLEKISKRNKEDYAKRHGYDLIFKSEGMKRRYAHEWRESWEKADYISEAMEKYPNAEWFWWLDLTTYIMEPQYSIENHIINRLPKIAVRNITDPMEFNPRSYKQIPFEDYSDDISLIMGQDCNGFSLGSFIIRRSEWSKRLIDFLWDPVVYGQKHTEWPHDEQNVLEYFYEHNAWLRSGIAFVPLRTLNAYTKGACEADSSNPRFFYSHKQRDFLVNLAGCNYGRNCKEEMKQYQSIQGRRSGFSKLLSFFF